MNLRTSWPAIFAGTFFFLAIEITFGFLAAAIFGPHTTAALGAGAIVWMVVLSISALGVAGRASTVLSGETQPSVAMHNSLAMFGLCIFAAILIAVGASRALPATSISLFDFLQANAAWLFITLILGGIAAEASSVPRLAHARAESREAYRPAA